MQQPVTHSDQNLDEKSRAVYMKALNMAERMLDGVDPMNTDKLSALAQVADASACGFKGEGEAEYD